MRRQRVLGTDIYAYDYDSDEHARNHQVPELVHVVSEQFHYQLALQSLHHYQHDQYFVRQQQQQQQQQQQDRLAAEETYNQRHPYAVKQFQECPPGSGHCNLTVQQRQQKQQHQQQQQHLNQQQQQQQWLLNRQAAAASYNTNHPHAVISKTEHQQRQHLPCDERYECPGCDVPFSGTNALPNMISHMVKHCYKCVENFGQLTREEAYNTIGGRQTGQHSRGGSCHFTCLFGCPLQTNISVSVVRNESLTYKHTMFKHFFHCCSVDSLVPNNKIYCSAAVEKNLSVDDIVQAIQEYRVIHYNFVPHHISTYGQYNQTPYYADVCRNQDLISSLSLREGGIDDILFRDDLVGVGMFKRIEGYFSQDYTSGKFSRGTGHEFVDQLRVDWTLTKATTYDPTVAADYKRWMVISVLRVWKHLSKKTGCVNCPYCNVQILLAFGSKADNAISLDRIINIFGHMNIYNLIICCSGCNNEKNQREMKQWIQLKNLRNLATESKFQIQEKNVVSCGNILEKIGEFPDFKEVVESKLVHEKIHTIRAKK